MTVPAAPASNPRTRTSTMPASHPLPSLRRPSTIGRPVVDATAIRAPSAVRLAVALAVLGVPAVALAQPALTPVPATPSVTVGQTVDVTLRATGFTSTATGQAINAVSGAQGLAVQFPAGRMEVLSVTVAPAWNFATGNSTGTTSNAAGTVTGMAVAALPALTGANFDVVTVRMRALQSGAATVRVTAGTFAARVNTVPGQSVVPAYGQVTINAIAASASDGEVPLPAWALALLGAGVAWGLRRARAG